MADNSDLVPPPSRIELPQTVVVVYSDVKREYFPTESQYLTEATALEDAEVVASYIRKLGVTPTLLPGNPELAIELQRNRPDMVLNLVGSVKGVEYLASTIPALLELLDLPYTGASILGESLAYNKFLVKRLLQQNGVPVPQDQLFLKHTDPLNSTLRFPLLAKLNEIHGAVEITRDAVSENEKHLRDRLKYLIATYKQPVLVEEYIVGREITAFLLEGVNRKVYLAEKIFKDTDRKYIFASFEDQWLEGSEDSYTYQKYSDHQLRDYVKKAFEITDMFDYGKFDVRVDSSGRYFFLDANTNPAFGPKEIDCAMGTILDLYQIPFTEMLRRLLLNTMRDAAGKERLPQAGDENGIGEGSNGNGSGH